MGVVDVNATERAKRSDELHYDNIPRRALCDRIANLESDLEDAKAENAKLRELVAKYSAAAKYLCGFSHCNECNLDCASVFGDAPNGWDCARMLLDRKARELGVDVEK